MNELAVEVAIERYEKQIAQLTKERDELKQHLELAYRAACHFMVCQECAEGEPCHQGKHHTEMLVVCEPLIGK